jgi:hypothetical protein
MLSPWLRRWATRLPPMFSGARRGSRSDYLTDYSTNTLRIGTDAVPHFVRKAGYCANSIQVSTWENPANVMTLPCAFRYIP